MERVQLIHWKADEAAERTEQLSAFGYAVDYELKGGPAFLRELGNNPPAAIIIDLSRLLSQGRDMALLLRKRKATRHAPLVFVGGNPAKVAHIKELLPDAVYTTWEQIGNSLQEAIANPPSHSRVPGSQFEAYAGKSLSEKLGIKANSAVGLVNTPEGFEGMLGFFYCNNLPSMAYYHYGICTLTRDCG